MITRIANTLFMLMCVTMVNAQTLQSYEYWIDSDFSNRVITNSTNNDNSFSVSLDGQAPGVHLLTIRAVSPDGMYGAPSCKVFYIPEDRDEKGPMASYEYWFDDDYSGRTVESGSGTSITKALDISHLDRGVHFYNFRAMNSDGYWGGMIRSMFYVPEYPRSIPQLGGYEYWFDDDIEGRKSSFSTNPNINLQLSLEDLSYGIHFFNFRERYTNQELSAPYRSIFYYNAGQSADGGKIIAYRYQFNSKTTNVVLPAEESSYTIDNLVIPFPETSEYAVVNKDCQFKFSADAVSLHRETKASFSIQFENKMHEWTMPEYASFVIKDDITKTPLPLGVEENVTFDKFSQGDFCAVKIDVANSGYYYLKSSQNADILLYKDGVLYNDIITSSELKNCAMVGLDAGTYYAIIYNTVMDEDNQDEDVVLRLSMSRIDDIPTNIAPTATRTGLYVWAKGRSLMISSDYATNISICDASGVIVRNIDVNEGVNEIRGFVPGIYIVNGKKIVLK